MASMEPGRRIAVVIVSLIAGAAISASACAGGGNGAVVVELDEFSVSASPSAAEAGEVAFEASNTGEIAHDLVVLRTDLAADRLPIVDGEVDLSGIEVVDGSADIAPGRSEELAVELATGSYVLICDVPGHYQSGMHAAFSVT